MENSTRQFSLLSLAIVPGVYESLKNTVAGRIFIGNSLYGTREA